MKLGKVLIAASALATASWTSASAYEFGFPGWQQKPGITLGGGSAATPPPGVYMFTQFLSYQANLVGPTAPAVGGVPTRINTNSVSAGLLFVPGWEFLGATYNAVIVQPVISATVTAPANFNQAAAHNTYIVPVELSWRLGGSGFFVKTGLGIYVPDGSIEGPTGLNSIGNPWWTFQPEFVVSYIKDGWNLTANTFMEINTENSITQYRTGNFLHAEFSAIKSFGKWSIGPVAYYAGQVSDDRASPTFYGGTLNANQRFNTWAVGGRVSYDFGPVTVNVWGLNEVYTDVRGPTSATGSAPNGFTVYGSLGFRLWAPDAPAAPPRAPMVYK